MKREASAPSQGKEVAWRGSIGLKHWVFMETRKYSSILTVMENRQGGTTSGIKLGEGRAEARAFGISHRENRVKPSPTMYFQGTSQTGYANQPRDLRGVEAPPHLKRLTI